MVRSLTDCCYQVARHLVQDTICCPVSSELERLPVKSPLFTTNLLAGVGELYSRVTGGGTEYSAPPPATVSLVTAWLSAGQGKTGAPLSVPGTSPAAPLLPWPVLGAVLCPHHQDIYSRLQLCLVDTVTNTDASIPTHYLIHLARATLATLARTSTTNHQEEEARTTALDRFGQIVTAVLAGGRTKPDKELELLLRKLPDNRLVQIVMKTYF